MNGFFIATDSREGSPARAHVTCGYIGIAAFGGDDYLLCGCCAALAAQHPTPRFAWGLADWR
jgi:hypothetical protein